MTTRKLENNSKALQEVVEGGVQISDRASYVSELSKKTTLEAEDGGRFVEDNLKQMRFIHQIVSSSNQVMPSHSNRSKEIGAILHVINAVADQINLLALNVELKLQGLENMERELR